MKGLLLETLCKTGVMLWAEHYKEPLGLLTCSILTLNMLNFFEDYKICIHISYHILDFIQQKKIRVTMEQPYVLPILHCQCHACWCTGDFRSQCISRHGIDLQSRNIPSLASEELTLISGDLQQWGLPSPSSPVCYLTRWLILCFNGKFQIQCNSNGVTSLLH